MELDQELALSVGDRLVLKQQAGPRRRSREEEPTHRVRALVVEDRVGRLVVALRLRHLQPVLALDQAEHDAVAERLRPTVVRRRGFAAVTPTYPRVRSSPKSIVEMASSE